MQYNMAPTKALIDSMSFWLSRNIDHRIYRGLNACRYGSFYKLGVAFLAHSVRELSIRDQIKGP